MSQTPDIVAFTDSYLPTVNGVTYTVKSWRDKWNQMCGDMTVVFPESEYNSAEGELSVPSLPFPFYDTYRIGIPWMPDELPDADIIHSHTQFGLGLAGLILAIKEDKPIVATFHTPTAEYANYLTDSDMLERGVRFLAEKYEQWFFNRVDLVIMPSEPCYDKLDTHTETIVLNNGIEIDKFKPTDTSKFRSKYNLEANTLVGYTGRHGSEKRLFDILKATANMNVTVVFAGDGPVCSDLKRQAVDVDTEVRFLGFLPREELPDFYSTLDAFLFPSPVETEGIVALEAIACGTPVVAADRGGLTETVDDGRTGYHFKTGSPEDFEEVIRQTLDEREQLSEYCMSYRKEIDIESTVDRLKRIYIELQNSS